jgi:hypothetical protein
MVGRILGTDDKERQGSATTLQRSACLDYMELEASLIEIESVINARPLSYIGEGADDQLPITTNQFLNIQRSTRPDPEPAVNLLASTSTSTSFATRNGQT